MKGRVLITDDEAHFRFSSRVALRRAGYQVEEAENGEEALLLINSGNPVDIMILDLNMPCMSGEEVVTVLKNKGVSMPIVAISGIADNAQVRKLMQRGCVAFMEKPFTPAELVDTVREVLALKPMELEGSGWRVSADASAGAPAATDGVAARRAL